MKETNIVLNKDQVISFDLEKTAPTMPNRDSNKEKYVCVELYVIFFIENHPLFTMWEIEKQP